MAAKRGMAQKLAVRVPCGLASELGKREMAGLPRRWIVFGAGLTVAGLIVAGTAPVVGTASAEFAQIQQTVGGAIVLAGWVLLAWAIHRLGRS
jgi:hypothetical protein